jgi:pentose-5-phosphate-3-epimerase
MIDESGKAIELSVDGGIDSAVAGRVVAAGARVLVAGSAIFRAEEGIEMAMASLLKAAGRD